MSRSSLLIERAQLAPPNPPPMTTTRGAALAAARAGEIPNAASIPPAAMPPRTARRLLRFRAAIPIGNGFDFFIRKSLGDTIHHGGGTRTGTKRLHRRDDLLGREAFEGRHRASIRGGTVTTQAR